MKKLKRYKNTKILYGLEITKVFLDDKTSSVESKNYRMVNIFYYFGTMR